MEESASQAVPVPAETVEALRSYTLAKEAARRHNRNLLQFAASFAAALGVESGSWGIMAVANSLENGGTSSWLVGLLLGIMGITGVIAIGMSYLLARAYTQREEAEKQVACHLSKLIELDPRDFLNRLGVDT